MPDCSEVANGATTAGTIGRTGAKADVCSGGLTGARIAASGVGGPGYCDSPRTGDKPGARRPGSTCRARQTARLTELPGARGRVRQPSQS